ncbi:beta-galactosidase A, putative [Babesia ovata]|uniref:Beta-galactosidase A, putative n=1 Tax=Babesia ovata TaxID=189622 RepID=A0A2H6KA56_9APIC|nr:beta-galactosidase A, putative [Babesia ovata]GBE59865.1 beta-galactosidase A, putative [Babesia ovata]
MSTFSFTSLRRRTALPVCGSPTMNFRDGVRVAPYAAELIYISLPCSAASLSKTRLGFGLVVLHGLRDGVREQVHVENRYDVRDGTEHDEVYESAEVVRADSEGVRQQRREVGADVEAEELRGPQERIHTRLNAGRAQPRRHDKYGQRIYLSNQLQQGAVGDNERRVRDP